MLPYVVFVLEGLFVLPEKPPVGAKTPQITNQIGIKLQIGANWGQSKIKHCANIKDSLSCLLVNKVYNN